MMTKIDIDGFGGWTAHDAVFSVECNSDYEILAALQTVCTLCM